MTTRDAFDIDDAIPEPENYPVTEWRCERAKLGAWALVWRGTVFSVVVVCALVIISWATGLMADALAGWLS